MNSVKSANYGTPPPSNIDYRLTLGGYWELLGSQKVIEPRRYNHSFVSSRDSFVSPDWSHMFNGDARWKPRDCADRKNGQGHFLRLQLTRSYSSYGCSWGPNMHPGIETIPISRLCDRGAVLMDQLMLIACSQLQLQGSTCAPKACLEESLHLEAATK